MIKKICCKYSINDYINGYVALFVLYMLLIRIVPYTHIIGSLINNILLLLFAVSGFCLFVFKFRANNLLFKNKYIICLLLFYIISIVSSVVNIKYGYLSNIKILIWMFIQYFVIFSAIGYSKKEMKNAIFSIGIIISLFMLITASISIIQFLLNIHYEVRLSDYVRLQGFANGRLFGIFDDPNYSSIASIIAMIFSVYFCKYFKKGVKILFSINVFVQIAFIILANSRTAHILTIVFFFLYLFFNLIKALKKSNIRLGENTIKYVSIMLVIVFLSVCLYTLYLNKSQVDNHAKNDNIEIVEKDSSNSIFKRKDLNERFLNNRLDIWVNALRVTKNKRILGVSPKNLVAYARKVEPTSYTALTGYETHNGYLSVFIFTGYIGTGVILVFIWFVLSNFLKKRILKHCTLEQFILLSSLIMLAISTLMLQDIFFMNTATTIIFWRLLGLALFCDSDNSSSIENHY